MPRLIHVIVRAMAKYDPLQEKLAAAEGETLTLSFSQIDELVQGLPRSARQHTAWWANETGRGHVQARAWMAASWMIDYVDFRSEHVTFRRA
jgi:hypothetical protein